MDSLKLENFSKSYLGGSFPQYIHLNAVEAEGLRYLIAKKLGIESCSDSLSLVKKVDTAGSVLQGFDANHDGFDISKILSDAGISVPKSVYINWYRYDDIDKIGLDDLERYFLDIWYPEVDDIDIFDDSAQWVLSIAHHGQVKLVR